MAACRAGRRNLRADCNRFGKFMDKKNFGILAEFDSATELVDAANKVREAGYTKTDAFSPFPLHEIDEALGIKRSALPFLVFGGGRCTCASTVARCWNRDQ